MNSGDITAYADDVLITARTVDRIRSVIWRLKGLEKEWGLKINTSKSTILAPRSFVRRLAKKG